MPSPELNNSITVGLEKCSIVQTQDKDFRKVVINMFKDIKEAMNKSLNEEQENTEKQLNEVLKTVQEMKVEIESLKKTKTETKQEMKNLECQTQTSEVSLTKRMEKRTLGIEEMDTSVKENVKCQKLQARNLQELWDTMERSNLRIIGIEEGEETQVKGTENICNNIID